MHAGALVIAMMSALLLSAATDEVPADNRRQAILDRHIGHLSPVGNERCISRRRVHSVYVISDTRVLYRVSRNLVFDNRLSTACTGMAQSPHLPQPSRIDSAMLCAGDTMTVADDRRASCTLGTFTVWRPATP